MDAFNQISGWANAGAPWSAATGSILVALCFVVFNTLRIVLYLPQLITCMRDAHGCPTINLWTWSSWVVANASTGLYMWIFQGDLWGLALNLGSAAMCIATVAVTVVKRRVLAQTSIGSSPRQTEAFAPRTRLRRWRVGARPRRLLQTEAHRWR